MSAQSDVAVRIVERVTGCGVLVGLLLGGSVGAGCERTDSDVDFFAIGEAGLDLALDDFVLVSEKNGSKLLARADAGFDVHIAYWTVDSFDRVLAAKPYMTYPLLRSRVVNDPSGLASRYRGLMADYFSAHPDIEQAWKAQLDALRLFKSGQLPALLFPQWSDFLRHLEATF